MKRLLYLNLLGGFRSKTSFRLQNAYCILSSGFVFAVIGGRKKGIVVYWLTQQYLHNSSFY